MKITIKKLINIIAILLITSCSISQEQWHESVRKIGAKSIYIDKNGNKISGEEFYKNNLKKNEKFIEKYGEISKSIANKNQLKVLQNEQLESYIVMNIDNENIKLNKVAKIYISNNSIIRDNPTHGFLGDIVKSAFTTIFSSMGREDSIGMNRLVARDIYNRRNIANSVNIFLPEDVKIGYYAIKLYQNKYKNDLEDKINTQTFVAIE